MGTVNYKIIKKIFILLLFISIILYLFMITCIHSKIYYVKFDININEFIVSDKLMHDSGDYLIRLTFPTLRKTFNKCITSISLETRNQKANLVECRLYIINNDESINFKIKKMFLSITDLNTNQVINPIEINLNNEDLTSNNKYVIEHQINFENIDQNKYNGFYNIFYYYDDFTNKNNQIQLNFDLIWEYDNKVYSYSNQYLLKKKWYGLDWNVSLD